MRNLPTVTAMAGSAAAIGGLRVASRVVVAYLVGSLVALRLREMRRYCLRSDESAANGHEAELEAELDALFEGQNASASEDVTSIAATFLRVTVEV